MIQGIRRRFIRIAVAVLSIVMISLTIVINMVNYIQVRSELEETLMNLSEQEVSALKGRKNKNRRQQNALDEARYFTAVVNKERKTDAIGENRMPGEAPEELRSLADTALSSGRTSGWIGPYLYVIREEKTNRMMAVFLNGETKMDGVRSLMIISGISCACGILLAWLGMAMISSWAIRPMIENAVRQKQFITDAGHELKTPLTVISADMDVLTMNAETNEWIEDTRRQVSNMRSLVNSLIYLSRMDEDGAVLLMEPVDFSDLVHSQAESFQGMAEFMGKSLSCDAQPDIVLQGDRDALTRLVSQLCDNAIKYAPDGDVISLTLTRAGREVVLTAENGLAERLSEENLRHLFDRFYRPDASRSRESGGYGIGLSMARAIMERHGGRIRVEQTDSDRIRFVCTFPMRKSRH